MKSRTLKRFHVPALWIIAAVILLMVLLGYYAYTNYQHEQDMMASFLSREAQTLIRALEAGTRTEMMGPMWRNGQIRRLLEETARNPTVVYLQVLDREGRLMMASGRGNGPDAAEILRRLERKGTAAWMVDGGRVFAVAERFDPFRGHSGGPMGGGMMVRRWRDWCRTMGMAPQAQIAVVGLSTEDFLRAQREDIRRALGTGVVLLLLGGAALYFLLVAQNAYTVSRALSETKSYAQNVVESISNGVVSVDRQGRVVSINGVACRLLGMTSDEAAGQYYNVLIPAGTCRLEPTIEKGERIVEKEMACTALNGKHVEVSVSASRLMNEEGEVLGAVVVLRDLKEIRELEERLRRSERLASMGRMVAGVAHELRNPLSSIKGFARYFQRKYSDSAEDSDYAGLMVGEVDRLNRVITDLLGFAQPVEPRRTEIDLSAAVAHALRLCDPEIREKAILVQKNLAVPSSIYADRDLLIQVLVNLFRNGVDAMEAKGRLAISAYSLGHAVEIRVSDTGCGISGEDVTRIFDPFFTTKQGGTGLGLSIVHSIVEAHGGRIDVESRPGEGTTFRMELPAGV